MDNGKSAKRVTEDEMFGSLEEAFKGDPEQSLIWQVTQKIKDPITPETDEGRLRIHPLLLALGLLFLIVVGMFLYFGLQK
jgi:hypothetical protein